MGMPPPSRRWRPPNHATTSMGHPRSAAGSRRTSRRRRSAEPSRRPRMPEREITVTVNGVRHTVTVEHRRTLAELLREDLALTGTHLACEHGVCGACTVLLDGEAVRACLLFAVQAEGAEVTTIEGLSPADGSLSPLQQ